MRRYALLLAVAVAAALLSISAPTTAQAEPTVRCTTKITHTWYGTTYVKKRCYGLSSSYQYRTRVSCAFLGGVGVNYGAWKRFGSGKWSTATCTLYADLLTHSFRTRRA